ncbi:phBC6A51 family helix-turn-helix protein [Tenacibaculum halocynthiae]|uniref:phBC6A51 family helix-turn-helix protein n=1 Tax=Tenacibaculum halocynthiae TaxID=1254437 RepID=UPI00389425CB
MQHFSQNLNFNESNLSTRIKKKNMVKAMYMTYSNVARSCKIVGINRSTHYRWIKNDKKYMAAIDEVNEIRLDESEAALFKLITQGNTKAIKFFLSTKGRHRGYHS